MISRAVRSGSAAAGKRYGENSDNRRGWNPRTRFGLAPPKIRFADGKFPPGRRRLFGIQKNRNRWVHPLMFGKGPLPRSLAGMSGLRGFIHRPGDVNGPRSSGEIDLEMVFGILSGAPPRHSCGPRGR